MSTSSETGTKVRVERKKVEQSYNNFIRKKVRYISLSFVIILIIAGIAVVLGCFPLSVSEVYSIIFHGLSTETLGDESVWILRMPRITLALLVGFGLAAAGTMMQGTLKNPLASPFTLGIAAGASFGASLALFLAEGGTIEKVSDFLIFHPSYPTFSSCLQIKLP